MRRVHGVLPAVVTDNVDPEARGRVRVRLPQASASGPEGLETWAPLAVPMVGRDRGARSIPDVNDEVLVAFEGGDRDRPYVIGCLWSSTSPPPETMDADRSRKQLCSLSGVKIILDDRSGQERFLVETPRGRTFTLTGGPASVELADSSGNSVKLGKNGIVVNASAKATISASQVEINSGAVSVNAGMSKFSGVVQCDTLISNSVVSASYTPGAGNVK